MTNKYKFRNGYELTRDRLLFWESAGLSDMQIAKECGVSRMAIGKIIRKGLGWERALPSERADKGIPRKSKEEKRANRRAYMRRWYREHKEYRHPNIRVGGVLIRKSHYVVMSQKLFRPLAPGEVVHHIDGNPGNNDVDNLMVFSSEADRTAFRDGEVVEEVLR